jgi:Ca2+-binding EF-hand superfamily protein
MNLIRFLGFTPKLSDVHKFIDHVDMNSDHTLDFREFLRLMHTMREEELIRARNAFSIFAEEEEEGELPSECLRAAMLATDVRWSKLPRETFETMQRDLGKPDVVTFDTFADIIKEGRSILAMEMRQQAGFSTKEIDQFKELFKEYDLDKNGTIERSELGSLLVALGIPMRTLNDQHVMLAMLQQAKLNAIEAGLEQDAGEEQDSHPHVTFWMLVYFLRMLCNKEDQSEVTKEEEAARDCNFSSKEVSEFRDIFTHWTQVESTSQQPYAATARRRQSFLNSKRPTLDSVVTLPTSLVAVESKKKRMSIDGVSRMLRSLNVSLSLQQLTRLESKLMELDSLSNGQVDFAGFLRLMSWMLEMDFADIKDSSQSIAEETQESVDQALFRADDLQRCVSNMVTC